MGRHRHEVLLCLFLVVLTLAAFWPICTRDYQFLNFDDDEYVSNNPHVRGGLTAANVRWALTTFQAYNWHPLTWLSLQLDAQLYGLDPRGFHFTNLLLHTASTVLLFLALWRMTRAVWRSAAVAALFAVHPLHVESVAWIAERKDVLSGLFWMLTLVAYAAYAERPGPGRYLLLVLVFALGLLAKPMLVTLPCVLLLLDYWPLRRWRWQARDSAISGPEASEPADQPPLTPNALPSPSPARLLAEKVPLLVLVAASSVMTVLAQQKLVKTWEEFPLSVRIMNALVAYVAYISQMLWPSGLAVLYPHRGLALPTWEATGAGVLLLIISGLVLSRARQQPYLTVGWLWYLGTLVPVIGLVQIGLQARADRYTYIPLIGLFILLVWGLGDLAARGREARNLVVVLAGSFLILCFTCTCLQVPHWRDSITLWQRALAVTSGNAIAHNNLGVALAEQGQTAGAIDQYEQALRIRPEYAEAHFNLATLLLDQGNNEAARRQAEAALKSSPVHVRARTCLGLALVRLGKTDEACRQFLEALQLRPDHAPAENGLGEARLRQGRLDEAAEDFVRAIDLDPNLVEAHNNLGSVLLRQGKPQEASRQFRLALGLRPESAPLFNNLGTALWRQGQWQEALECFRRAVSLQPNDVLYHCNLAHALHGLGQAEAAAAEYARAWQLDPSWTQGASQAAWTFATHPDASRRDGAEAVHLAEMSCQATADRDPRLLDILAAAYAEAGRYEDAVARAEMALASSTEQSDQARLIKAHLDLYKKHQPFRQPRENAPARGEPSGKDSTR